MATVLGVLVAAGCAGSAKPAKYAGDAAGPASMEVLPSLDIADTELTPEMRMARMLSAESLALAPPMPPEDTRAAQLTVWSEGPLADWLREKQKCADAAREELDRAAQQNHRQRIMAGALVGLVYEDVARALLAVPPPRELDSEPEVAAVFRELMLKQAEPYLLHAQLAYAACAGNAEGSEEMRHWSSFCRARRDGLPESPDAELLLQSLQTAAR